MKGLLGDDVPRETKPGAPTGEQGPADESQATPEEEKWGRTMAAATKNAMYDEAHEYVIREMEGAEDLSQSIGALAAEMVKAQIDAAGAVEKQPPHSILPWVIDQTVQELIELADGLGIVDGESEDQVVQLHSEASHIAAEAFVNMAPELVNPEGMAQMSADIVGGKYDG